MIISILFWASVIFIIYAYLGYPILIGLFAQFYPKSKKYPSSTPTVTLLIAAYNEEVSIARKLENSLALNYPSDKLQILVAADGSDDGTVEIVQGFAERGVELSFSPERRGKMAAINRALPKARGEIIVMSDANNHYHENVVRAMTVPFSDSSVGATSGSKSIFEGEDVLGNSEGSYWKYESWIKKQESRVGCCTAAAGEIFAFRKSVYTSPPDSIINDDFYMMMGIIKQGYRVAYTPNARSWEHVSETAADEVERRSRINAGRYQAMSMAKNLLPFDRPLIVWQVVSHKFTRPLVSFAMILAFVANLFAVILPPQESYGFLALSSPWNQIFFGLQIVFYILALLGNYLKAGPIGKVLYIPTFLVNSNWAALKGFWRFASHRQSTLWERVQRREEENE